MLQEDGTVLTWGDGGSGQLGNGTQIDNPTPNNVIDPSSPGGLLKNVKHVAAGGHHTLAAMSDGTVRAWGLNADGQVGLPLATVFTTAPVKVSDPSDPSGFLSDVKAVYAGYNFSVALKNNGTLWAWGDNQSSQLGIGVVGGPPHVNPTQVVGLTNVVDMAAGGSFGLALTASGTVYAWGSNGYGELGIGTFVGHESPVQVTSLSQIRQISAGPTHAIALDNTGEVYAWGRNAYGQVGDGTLANSDMPVSVVGLMNVISVAAGGRQFNSGHSLALLADGTMKAWGLNSSGQLGDGTFTNRLTPVPVVGLTNVRPPTWVEGGPVYLTIAAGDTSSMALSSLHGWGDNSSGQLGNGTFTSSPTPVEAILPPPPADTTAPEISEVTLEAASTSTARIAWLTSEPASSVVDYGLTAAYGSTANGSTDVFGHRMTLTGLSPNTTYHYRVTSADAANNAAQSEDLTFTTAPLPSSCVDQDQDGFGANGTDTSTCPAGPTPDCDDLNPANNSAAPPVIDPLADVDPTAVIGNGAQIAAGAQVKKNVVIGQGVILGIDTSVDKDSQVLACSVLKTDAKLMKHVTFGPSSVLGLDSSVDKDAVIGSYVTIGDQTDIDKTTHVGDDTTIGNNTLIDKEVTIGQNVTIGNDVEVKKNAVIPNGAVIPDGATVN
ncbi:hypothetical protein A3E39_00730 [Candidatus Uhrbacteria bacterium RIFCSPHIGHO2_12_FULL_60_25]|uniref:Fibronectin type-III domain-containing protein n=1 Tax=Candidatus Uhrbacteria bacterium RIFCSPHIGHO2_12_FULL_60_25 TaxID=1802399 RepID=A0A1F7UMW5_9BACT|nr:MAG: hypothetical protein A3E39_00730 [Candidatus Uhrbacteria bacterium RIFCSPHIGHO2_12_FULL_60_25]